MPVSQSLYRSSLWGTESKALAKSRNTISVCRFDSTELKTEIYDGRSC